MRALPAAPGAYLLLLDISTPITLPRRFSHRVLKEGFYGYAGSAYGPGGISARCRRHLNRPSSLRWHIDWLTHRAAHVQAIAFPGGSECLLLGDLLKQPLVSVPIERFGSSDCRQCPAHLVKFDGIGSLNELTAFTKN